MTKQIPSKEELLANERTVAWIKFLTPLILSGVGIGVVYFLLPGSEAKIVVSAMFGSFVPPIGKGVIAIAIAKGIDPLVISLAIGFVDLMVGIFLAWNFYLALRMPLIGKPLQKIQDKGKEIIEKKPWIGRLASVGVVIFVILPFSGSGAIGGTMVGRALGMTPLKVLIAVAVGGFGGSFAIAYGVAALEPTDLLSLGLAFTFIIILIVIRYMFDNWEAIQKNMIEKPFDMAADITDAAGSTMIKAVGGTGELISDSISTVVDAVVGGGEEEEEE